MELQNGDMTPVLNRVKRAQGQLAGVLRMLEDGRDLESVVNQLKAVTRALDRAGFALVATELRRNVSDGGVTDDELAQIEKYFLSLG
ncbi:metal-sensitive transcriptional regulator [Nocardioides dongkuii]|uniref:metal-sensitive transcriptional regulator n=1 Tax=Nocardioides dongkuii TaxID=2760089 RepID=UPI0015F8D420|nr:metal-sensitive transcriptional regulator [Nocardioides dongkuii]